jgi:hypothetical protein
VVNVKTLNGRDLLKDDMDFMLSQVVENMTDDILNDDLDFLLLIKLKKCSCVFRSSA